MQNDSQTSQPPISMTANDFVFLATSSNSSINPRPPFFNSKTGFKLPKELTMCQEEHHGYTCNTTHTVFQKTEFECSLKWVPGHGKIKVIRVVHPRPCDKCLAKGVWILTQRAAYTMPVTYIPAPAPVILPTRVIPAAQPAAIIVPAALRKAPTLPQQTPGPGSGGAPLAVPEGMIVEWKQEWMKSRKCYEWVPHYKTATPAANKTKQGYSTTHGMDPGPPPPGWGAQPNPFPAPAKTGYSTTHGRDPGPPPPGSK